jgi:uncharacterized sulfatase
MSGPNVIWLTLDSVRADHTSMAGYRRDTTPNLQRIATNPEGTNFPDCIASSNGTPVSSASILTGTQPSRHQVKISAEFLPSELDTVPELFGERGYRTACLSRNAYLGPGLGLDRGFDRFELIVSSSLYRAVPPSTLVKWLVNIRKHSAGFTTDASKHATPYLMNDVLKRWLREFERDEDPFFLYAHYNEPHRPFYPPLPYHDTYTDEIEMSPDEAAETAMRVHRENDAIVANGCTLSEVEWDALHAMYDAEISYTDEMVGRLYDFVQSRDLGETVFVVTADHGEHFGERGELAHVLGLDDAVTNVPLVVDGLPEASSDGVVQHIDVMKTLVAMAGGRTEQFQGVDLRHEAREYAISQRGPTDFQRFLTHNENFDTSRFPASLTSAFRNTEFRYLTADDRTELYRLPDEETDVSASEPDVAAEFEAYAEEWLRTEGTPVGTAESGRLTDGMRRQLRDLGYVE